MNQDIQGAIANLKIDGESIQNEKCQSIENTLNNICTTSKITDLSEKAKFSYQHLGDFETAQHIYEELRDLIPSNFMVCEAIGDCYRKQIQYDKAIEQYKIALDKGELSGFSPEQEATIYNSVALCHQEQDKIEEAIKSYKTALSIDKKNPFYLYNYGQLLFDNGKQDEALKEWKKAQDLIQKGSISKMITDYNRIYLDQILSKIFSIQSIYENFKQYVEDTMKVQPGNVECEKFYAQLIKWREIKNKAFGPLLSQEIEEMVDTKIAIKDEEILQIFYDEMNTMKTEFIKLIVQNLDKLESELDMKFSDCQIKIEKELVDISPDERKLIKDYYSAFFGTFREVFITSQIINIGKLTLDNTRSPPGTFLSIAASFLPFIGDKIFQTIINNADEFLSKKEMIETGRKLKNLESYIVELSDKVPIENQDLEDPTTNWKKVEPFVEKMSSKLETRLCGELYRSAAAKLGLQDAYTLIQKWLNQKIVDNGIEKFIADSSECVMFDHQGKNWASRQSSKPTEGEGEKMPFQELKMEESSETEINKKIWSKVNEAENKFNDKDVIGALTILRAIDEKLKKQIDEVQRIYHHEQMINELELIYWGTRAKILYQRLEDFEAARKSYEELRDLIPTTFLVYKAIGDCYRKQIQYDKAIGQYKIALRKGELNGFARDQQATIHNSVALCHQEQDKIEEAIKSYKTALFLDKKNPFYLCNYGQLLFDNGKQDKALKEWKKAQEVIKMKEFSKYVRVIGNEFSHKK